MKEGRCLNERQVRHVIRALREEGFFLPDIGFPREVNYLVRLELEKSLDLSRDRRSVKKIIHALGSVDRSFSGIISAEGVVNFKKLRKELDEFFKRNKPEKLPFLEGEDSRRMRAWELYGNESQYAEGLEGLA